MIRLLPVILTICAATQAFADEILPDPTRPTVDVTTSANGGAAVAASSVSASTSKGGLQSIIISPGRRAAVIDGVTIELGGKVGSATLSEVNEDYVVLRGAEGKRVVELFPGIWLHKVQQKPQIEAKPVAAKINKVVKKKKTVKKKKAAAGCENSGAN